MNIYDLIFRILLTVFVILTLLSMFRDLKSTCSALIKHFYWLLAICYVAAFAFDSCRKKIPRTLKKACKATASLLDEHMQTIKWVVPFLVVGGDSLRQRFSRKNLGDEEVSL